MTGKHLQHVSENFRILSEDEAEMMGVPTDQGQIYQVDEMTGNVKLMEGTKTSSEKHRVMKRRLKPRRWDYPLIRDRSGN